MDKNGWLQSSWNMKHFTSLCPALFCVQAICAKCFKSQTITLLRDIKHILHGTTIKLKGQHEETSIGCWAKESYALCMFSVGNAENNYVTWMKLFICIPVIVNLQNNEEIPHSCNLTLTKFDSLMPWQYFSQFLLAGQIMLQEHR